MADQSYREFLVKELEEWEDEFEDEKSRYLEAKVGAFTYCLERFNRLLAKIENENLDRDAILELLKAKQ